MNPEVNNDLVVAVRNDLQAAQFETLNDLFREIAEQLIAIYTPDKATQRFAAFTQFIEEDNESRLAFVVGATTATSNIGVNIRGLSRGGAVWLDVYKTDGGVMEGVFNHSPTLTVVELAPFLRLANLLKEATESAYPTDTQIIDR